MKKEKSITSIQIMNEDGSVLKKITAIDPVELPQIYGNKLTLPDRVIEWSICKFEFIDQCKDGDIIIHDKLSILDLVKLFNDAVKGLTFDDRKVKYSLSRLSSVFFMNWIWVKDNFSQDAFTEDPVLKIPAFKKSYVIDTNNIDNMNTYRDNI